MSAIVETAAKGRRKAGVDQAEQRGHVGPPRPRMAFRVGVVGHRPDRLDEAIADPLELQRVIRAILETIKNQTLTAWRDYRANYSDDEPLLTAISALAEGTDRLFAEAALEVGFALACVLPFPSDEYAKDFAENSDSLLQYRELLARASSSFELDGMRDDDVDAYGTCGRVVLNQSDLLVVVWDGQRRHRGGGTEDTLEYAVSRGVPVAWINAHAPHHWQLIDERSGMPRAPRTKPPAPTDPSPPRIFAGRYGRFSSCRKRRKGTAGTIGRRPGTRRSASTTFTPSGSRAGRLPSSGQSFSRSSPLIGTGKSAIRSQSSRPRSRRNGPAIARPRSAG